LRTGQAEDAPEGCLGSEYVVIAEDVQGLQFVG
jgi:hypothetical protein